jgi:hypothetical protein
VLIVTRQLRGHLECSDGQHAVCGSISLGLVGSLWSWTPMTGTDLTLLLILGRCRVCSIRLMNLSLKLAPASVVVPFQYTLIVWAVIFGYLFFGDVPQRIRSSAPRYHRVRACSSFCANSAWPERR